MDQLIERCAGLDVHNKTVAACVRTPGQDGQRQQHTRTFQTTTKGLVALRDWLASQEVTVVGMESTGAYWKAVSYRLETTMDCWLLNARHLRNVPGRKTDVADAAWTCQLVEHAPGPPLVRATPARSGSCATSPATARPSSRNAPARRERLEKLLEDAGTKLSCVASDVLGVSGRAMLAALVAGERDPQLLAELAKGRLRAKLPLLQEALVGRFGPHHGLLVGEMLTAHRRRRRHHRPAQRRDRPRHHPVRRDLGAAGDHPRGQAAHRRGRLGRDRRGRAAVPLGRAPGLLGRAVPGQQRVGRQAPPRPHPQGLQVAARRAGGGRPRRRAHQGHLPGRPVPSAGAATTSAPRSPWPTRSWRSPTTSWTVASPTPSWAVTGCSSANPPAPTPSGWSASWSAWATRSPWSPPTPLEPSTVLTPGRAIDWGFSTQSKCPCGDAVQA
jgi:transposase